MEYGKITFSGFDPSPVAVATRDRKEKNIYSPILLSTEAINTLFRVIC